MSKVRVIISTLDEFGEETEKVIKLCNSIEAAEQFVEEHEQDFADDPDIYAVYIEE